MWSACEPLPARFVGGVYVPRTPTTNVLYDVVRAHLTAFVGSLDARTDGVGLPERAAHLVDHVLPPDVPVRQWVLSVPPLPLALGDAGGAMSHRVLASSGLGVMRPA